ncbi:hypothetical protein [Streptomyces cucumeris]|uniref:hypothetical protein n=1 Tax=Streptomyces cucumeris TaxID=2962890 RepID=UPI003D756703
MQDSTTLTAEVRDLPPQSGWRVVETTGQMSVACPCGLNTGFIPAPDAARIAQDHLEHPQAPRV